jgi:hypothetical protein
MTDRDPKLSRTLLSIQDLRWRALAEIRKQPGCSDVQGIAINRVTDERAENNWSLCVLSAGASDQHGGSCRPLCPRRFAPRLRSDDGLTASVN